MNNKSVSLENRLLGHLFMGEPMGVPTQWWMGFYQDPAIVTLPVGVSASGDNSSLINTELNACILLGERVPILSWTKSNSSVSGSVVTHGAVYNAHEIYLPIPPSGEMWVATHFGIWNGPGSEEGTYLLYWGYFERPISFSYNSPKVIPVGQMLIREY